MSRSRHTEAQMVAALKQVKAGRKVEDVALEMGVSNSRHFLAWCSGQKIDLLHIQPGKPMQNGRLESLNGKLCDEFLNISWFRNLFDARRQAKAWREDYK